jgi:hypothetical protein
MVKLQRRHKPKQGAIEMRPEVVLPGGAAAYVRRNGRLRLRELPFVIEDASGKQVYKGKFTYG